MIVFEVKLQKCKPFYASIGIEFGIDCEKVDWEVVLNGVKDLKVQSGNAHQLL